MLRVSDVGFGLRASYFGRGLQSSGVVFRASCLVLRAWAPGFGLGAQAGPQVANLEPPRCERGAGGVEGVARPLDGKAENVQSTGVPRS